MNILGKGVSPRVGQLDASLLDAELLDQLKDKLWDAFKFFRPDIKDSYEQELKMALRALMFKATVWDHSTTYGAKLQNLKLVDARTTSTQLFPISSRQKALYGAATVLGSYLWAKANEYLSAASYDSADVPRVVKLRSLIDKLNILWLAASVANFLGFLYNGRYSTLLMRLLRIKWVPVSRRVNRMVNFEFQNRQLVWNAMTEFLLFVLPLINFGTLKRSIRKVLPSKAVPDTFMPDFPENKCILCHEKDASSQQITNPYSGECGHPYCYICLRLKLAEEVDGFSCRRCTKKILKIYPVSGEAFRDDEPAKDGEAAQER